MAPSYQASAVPDKHSSAPLLGAHMSTSGGVDKAIPRGLGIGCSAIQIFVKNNMQWFAKPFSDKDVAAWREVEDQLAPGAVFGHTGYLINVAAAKPDNLEKSRRSLQEELLRADQLGLPFLVLHPGAHVGAGVEAGIELAAASLDNVFEAAGPVKTRIALENTAGQGSTLGSSFEELRGILDRVKEPERFCICLDTAHLLAAGHDITTQAGMKKVLKAFDTIIGFDRLAAWHLNDSKTALGSRVDRHEAIGKGHVGLEAFRVIMNYKPFATVPKVLETPKSDDLHEDVENLNTLRSLLA